MICEIICIDCFLCMSHLDIVHMLSAYVSGHMHTIHTLPTVVLDMFVSYADNADVIHMSSLVLLIYPIIYNLVSAHCLHRHTLSVIRMLSAHVHIICLSSLTLLIFQYNLIAALDTQRLKKSKKLG